MKKIVLMIFLMIFLQGCTDNIDNSTDVETPTVIENEKPTSDENKTNDNGAGSSETNDKSDSEQTSEDDVTDDKSDSEATSEEDENKDNDSEETSDIDDESEDNDSEETSENDEDTSNDIEIPFVDPWTLDVQFNRVTLPYEIPEYSAQTAPYAFDFDGVVNKDQYYDFTEGQIDMLETNGFVVLKPREWPYLKMHYSYEQAEYADLPLFITSDAVLNMNHIFYSESMKYLETTSYHEDLMSLSESLLDKSLNAYQDADVSIKEDLAFVTTYYAIGASLLGIERALPEEIQKTVDIELERIDQAEEIELSVLYDRKIDYTQYIVRGHYTQSDILSNYFKSMMWFGQTGFQVTTVEDGEEVIQYDALYRSLMATILLLQEGAEDYESYLRIYDLTNLYSGYSDDLNILDYVALIKSVYGNDPDLKTLREPSYLQVLEDAVLELRSPQINAKLRAEHTGKQFRFMGQRYTLDANIMQELVTPLLRPLPTAFDMLSAFGHEKAEDILYEYYPTNQKWPEYDEKLLTMKELVKNTSDETWQKDLYHGWLWSIDAAAQSFEEVEGMPSFMQNEAWSHKSISAALGSYTELKHDNILYAKQSMAEMGGNFSEEDDHHYVEPNVEMYAKLLWLVNQTKANLELNDGLSSRVIEPLTAMSEMLELLLTCSIKELEGETITPEEMSQLEYIGGLIDYVDMMYFSLMYDLDREASNEETSALIADIATADHVYMEEAIGLPMDIYVLVPINGQLFLSRGSVYSYYEFMSAKRLTTEQWHEMIGLEKGDEAYSTTHYIGEQLDILTLMPWMASYISPDGNNVKFRVPEVDWGE